MKFLTAPENVIKQCAGGKYAIAYITEIIIFLSSSSA